MHTSLCTLVSAEGISYHCGDNDNERQEILSRYGDSYELVPCSENISEKKKWLIVNPKNDVIITMDNTAGTRGMKGVFRKKATLGYITKIYAIVANQPGCVLFLYNSRHESCYDDATLYTPLDTKENELRGMIWATDKPVKTLERKQEFTCDNCTKISIEFKLGTCTRVSDLATHGVSSLSFNQMKLEQTQRLETLDWDVYKCPSYETHKLFADRAKMVLEELDPCVDAFAYYYQHTKL